MLPQKLQMRYSLFRQHFGIGVRRTVHIRADYSWSDEVFIFFSTLLTIDSKEVNDREH